MKINNLNFDWNNARAFLITAREGSLTGAAKKLGISQPTLSRQVVALEMELSTALFERGSRGLEITPTGLELLDYVERMGDAANQLGLVASGKSTELKGSVTISTSELMATYILPKLIVKMKSLYPSIEINVISSNQVSNIRKREADIAIRSFIPSDEDLIAKNLGAFKASLYGRKDIEEYFDIQDKDFRGRRILLGFIPDNSEYIKTLNASGLLVDNASFSINVDGHIAMWEFAKEGLGVSVMQTDIAEKSPIMKRLYHDLEFTGDYWLVTHRELRMNKRIKTTYDFLSDELKAYLADHFG